MKVDPELQAALDAVASGPGDDGRRQVLADLLLERGDPRGEFLLLQFLISANQASGPLRKRADELWRKHKREWLAGVQPLLLEVKLARGFPVEAALRPGVTPEQVRAATASPMFCTLQRLRTKGGDAALLEAAVHPRMHALTELVLSRASELEQLAERGVAGRLRRLELGFTLEPEHAGLLVKAPAFSQLTSLTFRVGDPLGRAGAPARSRPRSPERSGLVELLELLGAHATLKRVGLWGFGLGDQHRFVEVASAWPRLRFEQVSAPGSFELVRAADGTELTLQNMTPAVLVGLRPFVPTGTVRVRLMPDRRWNVGGPPREELLAAFAGLDAKTLP